MLLYFALGKAGLLLALPPGFSSPIFPAAGFALGVVLLFGVNVIPGIFLGSLILNLSITCDGAFEKSFFSALLHPMVIAAGSSFQAYVSQYFIHFSIKNPKAPAELKQVLKLLFIGGPISCLIAATTSSLSGFIFDYISADILFTNWFSWYLGDCLGVVLFAPIILMLSRESYNQSFVSKLVYLMPLAIAFSTCLVMYGYLTKIEMEDHRNSFFEKNQRALSNIKNSLGIYSLSLQSLKSYFESSKHVGIQEFQSFSESLMFAARGIHSFYWFPLEGLELREAAKKSNYKTMYVTPSFSPESNQFTSLEKIGFSISELEEICLRNSLSQSKLVTTGEGGRELFFRIAPVVNYRIASGIEECKNVVGFVAGGFHLDQVIHAAAANYRYEDYGFYIIQKDASGEERLLYSNLGYDQKELAKLQARNKRSIRSVTEIEVFGQTWQVVSYLPGFLLANNRSFQHWAVLVMAILFSGLLSTFTLSMLGRNILLEREVKRATDRIKSQQANAHEEARLKSIGEMASGIAHEINNPLAIIDGYAERLLIDSRSGKLSQEMAIKYSAKIARTVSRAANIVEGLRKISRDGTLVESQFVQVEDLIVSTIGILQEKFKAGGTEIDYHVENRLFVYCNEVQISQVLLNLLTNSYHAIAGLDEKWVYIESYRRDSVIEISVMDSGHGISEDLQKKIFDPFFTTKEVGVGTGLGLSISKEVISANGGKLSYDSTSPNTRFTIELPIARKEEFAWDSSKRKPEPVAFQ